ncbi:urokinase plasminogen activator surface receptor isoform X2 [Manis javanica]|uniref:urokinase plasminogen activator surface receptor isoform X2 n=1 Tax=Manis javanica TaxID=9974 RepID=UPI00187A59C5|nr:urokinase plasminogen activator surface receptor isoform X2 [Manis javanica]
MGARLNAQMHREASWGLQCMLCGSTGKCHVQECAQGQDLCRTTVMRIWEGGEELEVVERGCAHPEKTNRTMSYRIGMQIISLTETVCESNMCNQPRPGRAPVFPRSRYLECVSCASSDLSCERGLDHSLQCRNPGDQCLEVVTHQNLQESPGDEHHSRGCGNLPGCPGPIGFHNNHSFHFLQCCNTTKCNQGPVLRTLAQATRTSCLDCCCNLLPGPPASAPAVLQPMFNTSASVIFFFMPIRSCHCPSSSTLMTSPCSQNKTRRPYYALYNQESVCLMVFICFCSSKLHPASWPLHMQYPPPGTCLPQEFTPLAGSHLLGLSFEVQSSGKLSLSLPSNGT